ncbi:arylesterase [Niveibacterium sp.]|uniref:arylesterase n=1 Tax=Niveibacterium sp. TaxID=2017444 RepID=UPI0035B1AE1E
MLRSIFALVCLCSGVCHAATILVFGDSLSAGFGLRNQDEAWASLLQKRLDTSGYRYTVVNASVSGETTAGGRTRLPAALAQHKPAIVILELGANDGLRGLPLKPMQENLSEMVRLAKKSGAKVVVVGMRLPPNYGPDYTEKFRNTFADVAKAEGTPLVPFLMEGFAQTNTYFQADGLHPTAAAQPRVLDNIWPTLKPLLKR